MKSTPTGRVIALAILTASIIASACSGVSPPALNLDDSGGGPVSDSASESSSGASNDSSVADSGSIAEGSPNSSLEAAPMDVCRTFATPAQCQSCCTSTHTAGYQTFFVALRNCVCGASGACQSQCVKEYCVGAATVSGDLCANCINRVQAAGGACFAAVNTACNADPDCLALYSSTGCLPACAAIGVGGG